jgi:hypothetical protein
MSAGVKVAGTSRRLCREIELAAHRMDSRASSFSATIRKNESILSGWRDETWAALGLPQNVRQRAT